MSKGYQRRRAVRALPVVLLMAAVAACGGSSQTKAADPEPSAAPGYDTSQMLKIKVGEQGVSYQSGFAAYAEALGYFKDENLEVERIQLDSGSNAIQAVLGGSINVFVGGPEGLVANLQGEKLRFVAGAANSSVWDLITAPEIKDLKELEGKAVAVSSLQSIGSVSLQQALEAKGVDTSKIKYIQAGSSSKRYAALTSRQVLATTLSVPSNYRAVTEGLKNWGNTTSLGAAPTTPTVLTVDSKWAEPNKEAVVRFLRAYLRMLKDLHDPAFKDKLGAIVAKYLDVSAEDAARAIETEKVAEDGSVDPAALQNSADAFLTFGAMKSKVDAQETIDASYLDAARETLQKFPPKS